MIHLGSFSKEATTYSITIERVFHHAVDEVWDALTNPVKMRKWFTDVEWDFREGGAITFIFQDEARTTTFGKINDIELLKLLEYEWYNDEPPHERARWELYNEDNSTTKLVLIYSGLSEELAVAVSSGWHMVVNQLGDFLDGRNEFPPFDGVETDEGIAMKQEYKVLFDTTFKTE